MFEVGQVVKVNSGRGARDGVTGTVVESDGPHSQGWTLLSVNGQDRIYRTSSLLPLDEVSKREAKKQRNATARELIESGCILVGSTVRVAEGPHEGKVGVVKRLSYDTVYVALEEDGSNPPRRIFPQDLETISVPDPKATAEVHESGLMVDDVVRYVGPEHSALTGLFLVVTGFLSDERVVVTDEDGEAWYVDPAELSIAHSVEEPELPPEPEPKPATFEPGMRVQFIGGGPVMFVSHIEDLLSGSGGVLTMWWDALTGFFESRYFNPSVLVEVK